MSLPLSLQISHKGSNYPITLPSDATLATLKSSIAELTNVPPTNQKLLYKGKKPSHGDDTTLGDAGFKDGFKVQMLGNTEEEIGGMRKVEDEQKRRETIMRERQAKGTVKVRFIPFLLSSKVEAEELMIHGPPANRSAQQAHPPPPSSTAFTKSHPSHTSPTPHPPSPSSTVSPPTQPSNTSCKAISSPSVCSRSWRHMNTRSC